MESRPHGQSDLRAMRCRGSGVREWFGQNDALRGQPSGVNRVERDRLLEAAQREHAEACDKPTPKGSLQGERGDVYQFGVPPKGNANFA